MALNRKYANLPDLDSAPDIYETPDLTDDNSTVPTTAGQSYSDNEFDEDEDEDGEGISRSRLRIDQARSRFLPSQVDAREADFSDRLNGKRKSYKTSSRRPRAGTEIGDFSDEEDGETLERKLARLKREIEEAKEEYGKQQGDAQTATPAHDAELVSLSRALEAISPISEGAIPPTTQLARTPKEPTEDVGEAPVVEAPGFQQVDGATYTITYAPSYEQSHALAKAADFDRRLVLLEQAIGITSSALPELESNGLPRAIIPTLDTLQRQILTLSEASTSSLDSISRRVRTLTQEADQLEKSRKAAKAAQEALISQGGSVHADADDAEQTAKINALYGTLPTIESMTPLLPPLLDRLRSLRAIHADAANASETLEHLERSQSEMAGDIKQWREGLEKIEVAMGEGETAMQTNMQVVEGWVKDLEAKIAKLS